MTALMVWPNFHREMEAEVDNQVAAPAATRTPNLHRANKIAHRRVRMEGLRQGSALGVKAGTAEITETGDCPLSFLDGMVAERSSPSRVRLRRAERALDRSGPLCTTLPPGRKGKILGMANQNLLDADLGLSRKAITPKCPAQGHDECNRDFSTAT